jgi:hypothetical protein
VIVSAALIPREAGNVLCVACADRDPEAKFGQRL